MNETAYRVLIVDDNRAIHEDFQKVLSDVPENAQIAAVERSLFDQATGAPSTPTSFRLTFAGQGEEGLECVKQACAAGDPFSLAFVDIRMPPGMDGVETARHLWQTDADLQIVICSAYSDYAWTQMASALGAPDRWVILKKPFDTTEVLQLSHALCEKWRLRQQTKSHVANLERTVAARTSALEQALRQLQSEVAERERSEVARREIERKLVESQRLESLGVLAGGVAHDFNNILTGILVSASMARLEAPNDATVQRHLQLIEENSRRAATLCEQMLAYAGRGRLDTRSVRLEPLIRETIDLAQSSLPRGIEINFSIEHEIPTVQGDALRLRQVVMNLLLNAAEAQTSAVRHIQVTVRTESLDADALHRLLHSAGANAGQFAVIEVKDAGIGMNEETLRRIFEPFFTTKFAGRGLGLCAVLGIVRSHHGAIDVKSAPGSGTTVRVFLAVA